MVLSSVTYGQHHAWTAFNREQGKGFVIVAGDDPTGELLGYCDEGSFNPDSLPPALEEWLDMMDRQLTAVNQGQATRRAFTRRAGDVSVAPLLTTKWYQRVPYNQLLPLYDPEKYPNSHCATGCVATAMAQIMKYWASKTPTKEIPAYTTETLGIYMPALPATTFDYDKMIDDYNDYYTEEQALAVAKLMLYCGQAAQMDYDFNSGTETTGAYFAQYFGFKNTYEVKESGIFSHIDDDTGRAIYNDLRAGRPVLFSGKRASLQSFKISGHAFVVDGYDASNGLYHINWGYGGTSNGYFQLKYADSDKPDSTDDSYSGYRFAQKAVIGLEPEDRGTAVTAVRQEPTTEERYYTLDGRRIDKTAPKGLIVKKSKILIYK